MTRKEVLQNYGLVLLKNGLNVIAVDAHKRAVFPWKEFTEDPITNDGLINQLNSDKAQGIAVICGAVSGNLEVIDFDIKNDLTGTLMERYFELIPLDLIAKLHMVKTKSGGFHIYYRCEVIDKNKKLASRPATEKERKDTPHIKQLCIIETRGEGGYVVSPPSEGYTVHQDKPIPVLSLDERDTLIETARSFTEIHEEVRANFTSTGTPFVISPFDDYNAKTDSVALLTRHGWTVTSEDNNKVYLKRPGNSDAKNSANYHKDKRLFYVWTSSTEFVPEKAYSPSAIYAILMHNGDYSAASKALIAEGYGTKKTPESVKEILKKPFEQEYKFWEVSETKKGSTLIEVNLNKLVTFIHKKGGFTGYKYNSTSENIIVQVRDGFVREVEMYDIKQFLKNEILSLPNTFDGITPDELLEVVYREYLSYLSKGFMDFLDVSALDFLKDTKDKSFFPFRNGIVEVSKTGCKFHKYGEFKQVIWASQMIDRDITLVDDLANSLDFLNIDYCQFIRKASGEDQKKFEYFISVLGYLLHKYKDPKSSFAVILAEETENDSNGGGTGKGLFVKGVKELIPTEIFDGKQFNPGKSFAFQRVSLDTKLIAIEDARKGFNFENMYSFITEGLPVEKKNQKEFFIPFADSPKITISTNYVISDEGNHAKRRQKVLEFSNYFSPLNTPFDEFGRMLFEDWDNDEWNRFYNFMFFSCQVYLEGGILDAGQSDSNKIKNIKLKYGEDLLIWFNNYVETESNSEPAVFKTIYSDFLTTYDINAKDYEKTKFSKGLKYICDVLEFSYTQATKKIDGKAQSVISIKIK